MARKTKSKSKKAPPSVSQTRKNAPSQFQSENQGQGRQQGDANLNRESGEDEDFRTTPRSAGVERDDDYGRSPQQSDSPRTSRNETEAEPDYGRTGSKPAK